MQKLSSLFSRISAHLAFWFCFSSIVLTIVLAEVTSLSSARLVRDQIGQKLAQLAYQANDKLDRGMFERYREVQMLADRPDVAERQALLDTAQQTYRFYAWLGVTDLHGRVLLASHGVLAGADASSRPWFRQAMAGVNVGDLHDARLLAAATPPLPSGAPLRLVDLAFPYRGRDGQVAGVLSAQLNWEWAREVEESVITRLMRAERIEAMIVDRAGVVILGPASIQGKTIALPSLAPGGTRYAVEQWDDGVSYAVGYSKSNGYESYPGLGWTVVVRQDAGIAFAPVDKLRRNILWAGFAIAALFSLFGVFNARRITRPLVSLARAARRIRLGKPAQLGLARNTYREIDDLSEAFGALVGNLKQNEDALRQLNATLEDRVAQRTQELSESETRLRAITDNLPALIGHFDRDCRYLFVNQQLAESLGKKPADMIGRTLREERGSDTYERLTAHLDAVLRGKIVAFEIETTIDDAAYHYQVSYIPDVADDGQVRGFYSMTFDITERKNIELRQAASEQRLRAITDNLPVLISYVDRDQRFRFCNATFHEWMGILPSAAIGRTVLDIIGPELYAQRRIHIERALAGERVEFAIVSESLGVVRNLQTVYVPERAADGSVAGYYSLSADVTAMKEVEQKLSLLARHDTLTGLPNRYQLNEKLDEAVRRCRRSRKPMAVVFLDIDHFKSINDSLGHAAGDEVLKEVGRRLTEAVRGTDTVGRLAGDEFLILLEGLNDRETAEAVARKIIDGIRVAFAINGGSLFVSTSIGVAYTTGTNLVPEELMACADKALYAAKADGRNTFRIEEL